MDAFPLGGSGKVDKKALDLHWKPFRKIKRKGKWSQVVCVLVTFHLFAFGLLIFSGRLF